MQVHPATVTHGFEISTSPMEAHVLAAPLDSPGTFTIGQHGLEMWHTLARSSEQCPQV
jgi:hypothetical protein